jgi:hypothetical protein
LVGGREPGSNAGRIERKKTHCVFWLVRPPPIAATIVLKVRINAKLLNAGQKVVRGDVVKVLMLGQRLSHVGKLVPSELVSGKFVVGHRSDLCLPDDFATSPGAIFDILEHQRRAQGCAEVDHIGSPTTALSAATWRQAGRSRRSSGKYRKSSHSSASVAMSWSV